MGDDGTRRRRPERDRPAATPAVLTPPTGLPATPARPGRPGPADAGAPAPRAVLDPCACRHARVAHEHWRQGSDCGICGPQACPRYRRQGGALRRFLRRARLVA